MTRIAFCFLFIIAKLIHYSSGSSCDVHDGYRAYIWDGSTDTSEITNITEFKNNLDNVLGDFDSNDTAKIKKYAWFGLYKGEDPNAAYSQGRCIGYVENCLGCIQDAKSQIQEDCEPVANSSILWYGDRCMVQYSNHYMFDTIVMPDDMITITNDTLDVSSNADAFNSLRVKLFKSLSDKAASRPGGDQMLAAGKWHDGSSDLTIYGAAQCSPNLVWDQCASCLDIVGKKLEDYFYGKVAGSIVGPSCNYRYDVKSFVDESLFVFSNLSPPAPPPPALPPQTMASASASILRSPPSSQVPYPPSTGGKANKALVAIYILVPLFIISIIIFVGIFLFLRKKKLNKSTPEVEIVGKLSDGEENIFESNLLTEETLQYDFSTISTATENFSEANMLGQGGFGSVYKGRFQNGEEIAVKRLSETSGQGEVEFKNEVTLLAKLQHRNLVRLLGFCLKKKERLLIYEFVANSSLDNYIFDPIKRANLTWDQLYKIIIGVARGILYLHEDSRLRIIHRDLKSSNVLLDNEMTPKIADFGMARLFLTDETQGNTSRIVGTYGYMAPEYAMHGLFSVKSDVFSFGVLLLEIVCGRRNTFFRIENSVEDLLSYAWKNWEDGTIIKLLDPTLRSETSSTREITRCIHIGLLCAQEDETERPTMASVFNLLSNLSISLPVPLKPAFFHERSINQRTPLLKDFDSGLISNSSESINKSSMSWSTTQS